MTNVIGISDTHNASAALLSSNGNLLALQEERLTREKNYSGFPGGSIKWLLSNSAINIEDLKIIALAGSHQPPDKNRNQIICEYRNIGSAKSRLKRILRKTPVYTYKKLATRAARIKRITDLGVNKKVIRFYDHHTCHAASAYYSWGKYNEPILVITCDGAGDGLCASVNIGQNGKLQRLYSVDWSHSFGILYAVVTYMAGMVPLEHEYKIMGMAPYAKNENAVRVVKKLEKLFEWHEDNPCWKRAANVPHMYYIKPVLEKLFFEERFDSIMAGSQLLIENMLKKFVSRAIEKSKINKIAVSGGVFMNVKANKEILEMDYVDDMFIMPSCGDETNAIGACYLAMEELGQVDNIPKLGSFYLGPEWDPKEIETFLRNIDTNKLKIDKYEDINEVVARLLAEGNVVARFAGAEEFGARSLGNRAILADPRNPDVVPKINEMIKNRDFWMPFAASILDEYSADYLKNEKRIDSPYMILSFDTTERGSVELKAGTHPYDKTCRPQIVSKLHNPEYWDLIKKFSNLTGVGGLLNTSLNLHGLPLAHKPEDALEVLQKSGLEYLVCGNYLLQKL